MLNKEVLNPSLQEGYTADNRRPIWEIYDSVLRLEKEFGWIREVVFVQELNKLQFPIFCLRTPNQGPAFWIFAGIHGEEPAGPNALAKNIEKIEDLKKVGIPIVLFPLCNPMGYFRDWRYPNEYRDKNKGKSVGDIEWILRGEQPSCPEAECLSKTIVRLSVDYPPVISIDHHEDEDSRHHGIYIYSQGQKGAEDPVALKILEIIKEAGFPIQMKGETEIGEKIIGGIVSNPHDGSIDELMASRFFILNGQKFEKLAAKSVIVPETPTHLSSLAGGITVHSKIIESYWEFWQMVNNF